MREELLLEVPGIKALSTPKGVRSYVGELMDNRRNIRSLPISNFIIHKDKNSIVSNDFRIVVRDTVGKVPLDVMLNIASIAYLILGKLIDPEVGYQYIKDIMVKYGVADMEFRATGYLSIDLNGFKDLKLNRSVKLGRNKPK